MRLKKAAGIARLLRHVLAISLAALGSGRAEAQVTRFHFAIDPETPWHDLLPVAPDVEPWNTQVPEDLARVPEVHFQAPMNKVSIESFRQKTAHQIAKINFLNAKNADRFIEILREKRPDLAGLPFVLGDACRLEQPERAKFARAVLHVRESERPLRRYDALGRKRINVLEDAQAVAALTQMQATELSMRPSFIELLARSDSKEATQALARIAIFGSEDWIRRLAIAVLQKRDTRPATDILLQGLRYPWSAVARSTADVVVRLQRNDLIPELTRMLELPDPRVPALCEMDGKKVHVVRELVRINHLRNCLLCHPPANTPDVIREGNVSAANLFVDSSMNVLTGEVPFGRQTPHYAQPIFPDLLVRADVTYLRQDFSLLLDAQRFDYLVRTRVLTDEEAQLYQAESAGRGAPSPFREAALTALRGLAAAARNDSVAPCRGKAPRLELGCCSGLCLLSCSLFLLRRKAH